MNNHTMRDARTRVQQKPGAPTTGQPTGQATGSKSKARETLLPLLYAMDQEHGWSQGMRAITHALLAQAWPPPGPVLEVGCGAGNFLREWQEDHAASACVGIDRNSLALLYAERQPVALELAQADLQQLPFADNHFGLIVALDAFDQRAIHLPQAIGESWRLLQPNGQLLVRVSAYPWLHSAHDEAFNTGRRYQRQELMAALRAGGFAVERVTYANSLLALPVMMQRLLQRWGVLPFSSRQATAPWLNRQVARLLRCEARLLHTYN